MLTDLETKLLGVMMMVIMLGMGASLTFRDFLIAFRKPKGVLVGLLCQFGIMPLLGYVLASALGLPPALAIGLILMSCMPGGTTSNIFTYFAKGDLALSIIMTSVSTVCAVVMTPLLLGLFSSMAGAQGDFSVPAANVAQVLVVMIVPTFIGMVLRKANPNVGATVELIGSLLGVAVIIFLMASWVPRNYLLLLSTHWSVFFAVIGLGVIGMFLGFWLSRALRQDPNRSRTISLEIGIQNGPLAVLIVTLTFSGTLQQQVLLIPVLYSLFIVMTASLVTVFFRRKSELEAFARDRAKEGSVLAA